MRHTVNEWQDLSLKKDVENVAREIKRKGKRESILTLDLLLAILAIMFDHLFSENECERIIVLSVIAGLAVIITAIYFLLKFLDWRKARRKIKSGIIKIKPYVDLFDNNICYYAMTANTFRENFQNESHDSSIKNFYFIESNYYVNKCITELNNMKNLIGEIFTNDENEAVSKAKIHTSRLENIILLLCDARVNPTSVSSSIEDTIRISKIYDARMIKFVETYNKQFEKTIEWTSFQ